MKNRIATALIPAAVLAFGLTGPAMAAQQTIDTVSANGKRYEVYLSTNHQSVYVKSRGAGTASTNYTKAGSGSCAYKSYGSCKSRSEMLGEIRSKLSNGELF